MADLSDLIRRLSATGSAPPGGRDQGDDDAAPVAEWLTVTDPELAIGWLNRLQQWIRDVWNHYTPVTRCWPWHPHAIAELLACQAAWSAASAAEAPPDALATWHDRWRPSTATRVGKVLTGCERTGGLHVIGITRWTFDPACLDEIAEWWATTHGRTAQAPGLTRDLGPR